MGRTVKVILQPVKFRKRDHVAVLSPNSSEVDAVVREFEGAEWSTGYRFWHIPLDQSTVKAITRSLKGVATVDSSAFKDFKYEIIQEDTNTRKRVKSEKPSEDQVNEIEKFRTFLLNDGYRIGTIKVYISMLNVFFGWFKNKTENELTENDIDEFITKYIDENQLTYNYKRLMINSLRRYFNFKNLPLKIKQ